MQLCVKKHTHFPQVPPQYSLIGYIKKAFIERYSIQSNYTYIWKVENIWFIFFYQFKYLFRIIWVEEVSVSKSRITDWLDSKWFGSSSISFFFIFQTRKPKINNKTVVYAILKSILSDWNRIVPKKGPKEILFGLQRDFTLRVRGLNLMCVQCMLWM